MTDQPITSQALPVDDMPELESGDDLAQKALASAQQKTLPSAGGTNSAAAGNDIAQALTALQNVIERNANELDRVKDELKEKRESFKNVFENDVELADAEEQIAVFDERVKERKSKIQASPQVINLKTAIGELNEQKKEIEEALSNHLVNLYKMTGAAVVDMSNGEQREFKVRASLISGKKERDDK